MRQRLRGQVRPRRESWCANGVAGPAGRALALILVGAGPELSLGELGQLYRRPGRRGIRLQQTSRGGGRSQGWMC